MRTLENALQPERLPTYEGSGQATHPSVLHFPQPWRGYGWWMAMTPYPYNNDSFENPSILASRDGRRWEMPDGASNPLVRTPQAGHNCDAELVYHAESDELWLYYVEADDRRQSWVRLLRSDDGVRWTRPQTVLHDPDWKFSILSPAICRMADGTWRMWYVDTGNGGYKNQTNAVRVRSSADGLSWGEAALCPDLAQPGYQIWHLSVRSSENSETLRAVYPAYPNGGNCDDCLLFCAEKAPGGSWRVCPEPLLRAGKPGSWDDFCVYRSSFCLDEQTRRLRLWYGGKRRADASWGIGYTEGTFPERFSG